MCWRPDVQGDTERQFDPSNLPCLWYYINNHCQSTAGWRSLQVSSNHSFHVSCPSIYFLQLSSFRLSILNGGVFLLVFLYFLVAKILCCWSICHRSFSLNAQPISTLIFWFFLWHLQLWFWLLSMLFSFSATGNIQLHIYAIYNPWTSSYIIRWEYRGGKRDFPKWSPLVENKQASRRGNFPLHFVSHMK